MRDNDRRKEKQRDKVPSKLPAFLNALLFRCFSTEEWRSGERTIVGVNGNIGRRVVASNLCQANLPVLRNFSVGSDCRGRNMAEWPIGLRESGVYRSAKRFAARNHGIQQSGLA